MKKRIDELMGLEKVTFEKKMSGQKVLVPFFTAFYPDKDKFIDLMLAAQKAGAGLIEIGLPFSDPIADGPAIQHSSEWVLKRGFSLKDFFNLLPEVRKKIEIPLVVMSYLNPVFRFGLGRFSDCMADYGIEGIIFPDLPYEELSFLQGVFQKNGISVILLVAPNTSPPRLQKIVSASEGFVYLVSRYGVTGPATELDPEMDKRIALIRKLTSKPVYAGFGISTPERAGQLAEKVDGVIVGSALIRIMMNRESEFKIEEITDYLQDMKREIERSQKMVSVVNKKINQGNGLGG